MTSQERPDFLMGIEEGDVLSSDEYEDEVRRLLAVDLKLAIISQQEFFASWESPLARKSARNLEVIAAIAERFLESPEIVTAEWSTPTPSLRRTLMDAQILEIIRRTILKPTDILINLRDEVISTPTIFSYNDDEFMERRVESITDEMISGGNRHLGRDLDEERVVNDLRERSVEEWERIVDLEDRFLTEHLQGVLNDQVQPQLMQLIEEINQSGVKPETRPVITALELIAPLLETGDLEGIEGKLEDVLGADANFRKFVQLL